MTGRPLEIKADGNARLKGRVALVTGAASGIGRSAALLMARHGARLLLADKDEKRLAEVGTAIRELGGEAVPLPVDIADEAGIEAAFREGVSRFGGKLHVLFANAGINGTLSPIESMPLEEWNKTVDVNLKGTFLTVKHAIPYLKQQGGSIIITSSVNGNRIFSNFGFSTYSTTKAGQVAFAKMAALELAQYRIRVNVICPGAISTNIGESTETLPEVQEIRIPVEFPAGDQPLRHGPGSPREVANLVLFLASDEASLVTGTEIYIDGAESLIRG
ncbi:SDR family NAD(P)-dependent oxidoreductase [Paenibacillus sp. YN15]|uniref:SDR family oxidoreductase n=1 Tax=Paenibacillus sp. YN15 TaxID=1742774 RepID=UPI000DCC1459|nr:SDR family NAD(P)-dependent oxidoreductase [Paenibacillus sp. YN15]RAV02306.1 3-oxoacyl-[acyl-carrier-protein] reductase [Paenibacillus sp. YN15]